MKKIDPSEYMVDGWDRQGDVRYVRGSRHNTVSYTHLTLPTNREV